MVPVENVTKQHEDDVVYHRNQPSRKDKTSDYVQQFQEPNKLTVGPVDYQS